MQTITTTYGSKANGAGKIVAKGGGRQRTVTYDPAVSKERNHGSAAGDVALLLGWKVDDEIVHIGFDNGVHKFNKVS